MALSLIILSLLMLGLLFFQAWMLWYAKREVARLERRLDESLDDQDLLDFQDRLQSLMQQARSAGAEMVQTVERRQDALEKTLVLVREAEKKLQARAQLMDKAADAMAARVEKLNAEPAKTKRREAQPVKPKRPAPPPAEAQEAKDRSYLVRPAPVPTAVPAEAPPAPAPVNRHQKVYDLADQGLNRDQIAKESGILPGEVELILNLRPRPKGR